MKKVKILFAVITFIAAISLFASNFYSQEREITISLIQNVEALADNENIPPLHYCIGTGTIDCYGDKVEYFYGNYSLDLFDE